MTINYVYFQDYGPPENVVPVGTMSHTCQDDLVLKVTQSDVPYFNAPIYLENKQQVRRKNYSITWGRSQTTFTKRGPKMSTFIRSTKGDRLSKKTKKTCQRSL